jgi:hypothetical protein
VQTSASPSTRTCLCRSDRAPLVSGKKLKFLSSELTFLSSELTFLSSELTFLSFKVAFLSSELTFLSSHHFLSSKHSVSPSIPAVYPCKGIYYALYLLYIIYPFTGCLPLSYSGSPGVNGASHRGVGGERSRQECR